MPPSEINPGWVHKVALGKTLKPLTDRQSHATGAVRPDTMPGNVGIKILLAITVAR